MFNFKELSGAVKSLIPYWATNLIKFFGLGTEYSMILNIILGQIVNEFDGNYIVDHIYYVLSVFFVLMICFKYINFQSFAKTTTVFTVSGSDELTNESFSELIQKITIHLIENYTVNEVVYNTDTYNNITITNVKNLKLKNGIVITGTRNQHSLKYELKGESNVINKFISEMDRTEKNSVNTLIMSGSETESTYDYPDGILAMTYVLTKKYGFKNLLSKKDTRKQTTDLDPEDDIFYNLFLIAECKKQLIENDIYITIERTKQMVKYTFESTDSDLTEFVNSCQKYVASCSAKTETSYKYKITLTATENVTPEGNTYSYTESFQYVNYVLVHKYGFTEYKKVYGQNQYGLIVLSSLRAFKFNDILLTITRTEKESNGRKIIDVIYKFQSDVHQLCNFAKNCEDEYYSLTSVRSIDTLYHYRLNGFTGDTPTFTVEILKSNEQPSYETFDNLHCDNKEVLINDMKRLNDLDYYKRTGLRRKKSYLFYGESGCGKTASVKAMALNENKNILSASMNLIKTSAQFNNVMNVKTAGNIPVIKNKTIYFFDEWDCGSKLKNRQKEKAQSEKMDVIVSDKDQFPIFGGPILDLGTVLTSFDGIGTYNGLIIVVATNYIDNIDPALCRDLRLTPMYFGFSKQKHVAEIVEKFFVVKLTDEQISKLPDRLLPPTKIICLCERYENYNIDEFINVYLQEAVELAIQTA